MNLSDLGTYSAFPLVLRGDDSHSGFLINSHRIKQVECFLNFKHTFAVLDIEYGYTCPFVPACTHCVCKLVHAHTRVFA